MSAESAGGIGAGGLRRRDPLLPNAFYIARREYRERVGSRPFFLSTGILTMIILAIVLIPLSFRSAPSGPPYRVGVYAAEASLADRAVGVVDSTANQAAIGTTATPVPSGGVAPVVPKTVQVSRVADLEGGLADVRSGRLNGLLVANRGSDGGLTFDYHTSETSSSFQSQLVLFGALSTAILDWRLGQPSNLQLSDFHPPNIQTVSESAALESGQQLAPQVQAARLLLGLFFVLLIFIALMTYSMWVAQSIAIEKSSRVMELMIGAASPMQLLLGKVIGVGAAGLTQYLIVLIPAAVVTALQGGVRVAVTGGTIDPLAGLTLPVLLAYGGFFLLGFLFYAFLYAAAASLISRQEDIQTLAMPLSLISIAGAIAGLVALAAVGSRWVAAASYVPFFSPFVMMARILVGRVEPWELVLCLVVLVGSIAGALWIAARVYSAGVLMYGQRPNLRTFLAAFRAGG